MISKYYTPQIEEFHVGFEYEWRRKESDEPFQSATIKDAAQLSDIFDTVYDLRVKYLDAEDLQSLGFMYDGDMSLRQLIMDINFPFVLDYKRLFVHIDVTWFSSWVVLGINVSVARNSVKTLVVHSIRINNKSELIVLMKQLNMPLLP